MKSKRMNVGLLSAAALVAAQSANASVLLAAGFYEFNNIKPVVEGDQPLTVGAPGISGWMVSPNQASQARGGSYDGTYGNSSLLTGEIPGLPSPAQGNGEATMRAFYTAGGFNELSSQLTFWVRNDGPIGLPLSQMFFDASDPQMGTGGVVTNKLEIRYSFDPNAGLMTNAQWLNPDPNVSGFSLAKDMLVPTKPNAVDYPNLYGGLAVDLASIGILAPGDQVALMIRATHIPQTGGYNDALTITIDNVAITAIPEPGSILGLGLVLASGLMLRNRRR